jgi:hypothetical protein
MNIPFPNTNPTLAERLRDLTRDFRFTSGQPAHCSDGVVDLSIDRVWDDQGRLEHLVTVFTGFPPRGDVEGHVFTLRPGSGDVRSGPHRFATDRRGQVRLGPLEPGDYLLWFEVPVIRGCFPMPEASDLFRLAAASASSPGGREYHFHDALFDTTLIETPSRNVALRVETDIENVPDRLVRFAILSPLGHPLVQGFVGMYDVGGGRAFGEILVEEFMPREGQEQPAIENLHLHRLKNQPVVDLVTTDRVTLERSLAATVDPHSEQVLQEVLDRLVAPKPPSMEQGD